MLEVIMGIVIDREAWTVTVGGTQTEKRLSPTELKLLEYLLAKSGEFVSSEELLREVWRYREGRKTRTLDVYVGRLQKKLGPGVTIETVRCVGRRLVTT